MMTNDRLYLEHRLLRELGGMTMAEMRARMHSREFMEHVAYWKRRNAEAQIGG